MVSFLYLTQRFQLIAITHLSFCLLRWQADGDLMQKKNLINFYKLEQEGEKLRDQSNHCYLN